MEIGALVFYMNHILSWAWSIFFIEMKFSYGINPMLHKHFFLVFIGFHYDGRFYFLYTHEGMQFALKYLAIIILHVSASFFSR